MPLFRRPDGDLVRDVPPVRRILPYLMRGRNESVVYHDMLLPVAAARAWLERANAARPPEAPRATLFHVFLFAAARALHERPGLNRFVADGRIYQRRGVWLSFAAKRAFTDDAPIVTCKVEIPATASFGETVARVVAAVGHGRSGAARTVDRELALAARVPGFVLRAALAVLAWLDRWNLLPAAMIASDPMYASLFAANLGSVGLDDVTHHLFEYGTVSAFAAMGTAGPHVVVGDDGQPAVRDAVKVRWSLDERIQDGFYCARSLGLVREIFEAPEQWLGPRDAPRDRDVERVRPGV